MKKLLITLIILGSLPLLLALGACGGQGGPQEHTFNVKVQEGKPVGGVKTFRVKQGDKVTISFSSDTEGEVHLHGYDLEADMAPSGSVSISFTANATGRFLIEVEGKEVQLGFLEVQPR